MRRHLRSSIFVALALTLATAATVAQGQPQRPVTSYAEMPDLTGAACLVRVDDGSRGGISAGSTSVDWVSVDQLRLLLKSPSGNALQKQCAGSGFLIRPRSGALTSTVRAVAKLIGEIPAKRAAVEFGSYYLRVPIPTPANAKPDDRLILLGVNSARQVVLNGERYTQIEYLTEHLKTILDRRERAHLLRAGSDEVDKTVHIFAPGDLPFNDVVQLINPVIDGARPVPIILDVDEPASK